MFKRLFGASCALACVLLVGESARADGMQCGDSLVTTGDSLYQVRSTCGDPDAAYHRVEYRTVRHRVAAPCVHENGRVRCETVIEQTVEVHIDEWTYDFGKDRFIEYLTFEQGQLVRVNEGSYGHKHR
ncbi:MAG TPA: DUF2845 domain-containing protein [Polyangiaceae bacterium]|nr:DUF2845 domain-containing protein [Polyangiaceae bacterium]